MSLQGCSGVKEVLSAGPVWVAAGQEAEIRAVQAGQDPPVQGVLSAMWNFMSTFDFDLRIHACPLHLPVSYYTSHPGLDLVFESCCHFSYPNPQQENMAPQLRHPGRTPPASIPNRPHFPSPADDDTSAMDTELVVKKSASKRHLKRL